MRRMSSMGFWLGRRSRAKRRVYISDARFSFKDHEEIRYLMVYLFLFISC